MPLSARPGIVPGADFGNEDSRKLMFATSRTNVRIIRVRSFDVAIFVAIGAAEIGIAACHFLENGIGASAGTSRFPVALGCRNRLTAASAPFLVLATRNSNASRNVGA